MTAWLAQNMVWASLAMLLVLLIRRSAAQLFGAGPSYALWLLPALRLVMPPLPAAAAPSVLPALDTIVTTGKAGVPLGPAGWAVAWPVLALAFWAIGAVVFLAWQWLAYRRFLSRLSLSSRSLGSHAGLPLVESGAVDGPLALGLLDRRIVVPLDFATRYSPGERQLALDHETVHHRRGDIWCNLAALIVLAMNWFNPIAWFAFRAYREDQELACDASVAARAAAPERHDYAMALVKSASRHRLVTTCPLNHADQLKRRLKMIKRHRPSVIRTLAGTSIVALLGAATLTLGSAGAAHPHPEGAQKQHRIIIMEKAGEGGEGAVRAFRMHRDEGGEGPAHSLRIRRGENGSMTLPEGCRDGEQIADIDEATGNERTRIVLCGRGDASPAERAEHLQRARERLAQNTHLSDEQRSRISAALEREIARLRGN